MNLSDNFTLEEMVFSATAIRKSIDNTPSAADIESLKLLCENVLERILGIIESPMSMKVTSGFRSKELNKAIGGSETSQHCFGQAADIQVYNMTTEELYDKIKASDIAFDELILEFPPSGWVHISYSPHNRRIKLIATKENGQTKYTKDLT